MASIDCGFLKFLRRLEREVDLICPLKSEIQTLRLKASFLNIFLCCKGKWHIENEDLKVLLRRIQNLFQNADLDLRRLHKDLIRIKSTEGWGMPMNMDNVLSGILVMFQLLDPDIQEAYTILYRSSRFITSISNEVLVDGLNSQVENIEDLLRSKAELVAYIKIELKALQKSLRLLGNFLVFIAKRSSKIGKLKALVIHVEYLTDNISCLLYLCATSDKMNDQMVKDIQMQLLFQLHMCSLTQSDVREIYMKALKAPVLEHEYSMVMDEFDLYFLDSLRDYTQGLSDPTLRSLTPVKDQILSLLFIIKYFLMDSSSEEQNGREDELTTAAIDETNEGMVEQLRMKVSDLLARKMYDLYFPESFRSNFPRTNGQGFIGSLLWNLSELLNTKADLVAPLKRQIEIVQKQLVSLLEDLNKTAKQPSEIAELQSPWRRFIDAAYQTEYVVESFVGEDYPLYCHELGLLNVIEEINTITIQLKSFETMAKRDSSVPHKPSTSEQSKLPYEKSRLKREIFRKEAEEIMKQLINGSEKLTFFSIVGMPGIGKTTLADSVFQQSFVTRHFHVRAKCTVSQVHDKRRLLREILRDITYESNQYSDGDLEQKLYQRLKGRRYLILIDDIWDIQPWEEIRRSFPDDRTGSRIMFTSRFDNIASQVRSGGIDYCLSPLPEDKSWELLESKVFEDNRCPRDLISIGREIAASCKGLPLTIDLIAGILRSREREQWKEVAESMMKYLFEDPQGRCQKVLELSYQNLTDDLRPCFLYLAAFLEDSYVPARDLSLLWIAEGFVQAEKDNLRSLEDVAKDMLDKLIGRSLLTVSKTKGLGGVKAVRVHDLLHEFALAKAREESFMLKIDGKSNFSTSSSDGYTWREQNRLCISGEIFNKFLESKPSGRVRALISFDGRPGRSAPAIETFSPFKHLKVLYIPNIDCCYPPLVCELVHLRLLAAKLAGFIHNLRNLETLIVLGHLGVLYLDEFCHMVRIRHLYCRNEFLFSCRRQKFLEKSFLFYNLQTLYGLKVSYADDIEKILKLMHNLVKLKIIFYSPDGCCFYPFPKLDFLKKLESLELEHEAAYPCKIMNFPPYLKKLVLSKFHVPWTEISEIGSLEYLEILKLKKGAFEGPLWDMNDGQFPRLKYLSLSGLDIEEWGASEDHLSRIEQLHVQGCSKLKDLPSCLAEIATLKRIVLASCHNPDLEDSAKRIRSEQEETGNEQLVLVICECHNPSDECPIL